MSIRGSMPKASFPQLQWSYVCMLDVISLCLNKLKQILLIRFSHILPHNVWHFELATDRMIAQNINPLTMHIVAIFEALCLMCGHSSFSNLRLGFRAPFREALSRYEEKSLVVDGALEPFLNHRQMSAAPQSL